MLPRHRRFFGAVLMASLAHGAAYAAECDVGCARHFPADSGIVDVRDFGAKGDGHTDDTAAIQTAINEAGPDSGPLFWRARIVWLPAGTYLVSDTLRRRYANGGYGSGMILMGESPSATVIRLADHASGFSDPSAPRGVVMSTSKLLDGSPTSGGKDYKRKGEGNDAYENFVENLTIDVGRANPGAIGIDYLANNIGAIRDVSVIAPDGSGATGISMLRKWPGPALLQRVSVSGFATGISVGETEYGITLDRILLEGQREVGLLNDHNSIAAAHLTVTTAATAIANTAAEGHIVLVNSALRRAGGESEPLINRGTILFHGVTFDGFPSHSDAPTVTGVQTATRFRSLPADNDIALADAPSPPEDRLTDWANVLRFADSGPDPREVTYALRRAFASGASTVYLPHGRYVIRDSIIVPPTVRRIVGMNSSITVPSDRASAFSRSSGMLRITQPGSPLTIEKLVFDMTDLGDQVAVDVSAPRDVVLRDIVTAGASLLDRASTGGRVFVENVCCGAMHIAGSRPVIARQFDTEGSFTRITNQGGDLVVLGLKTEGDCTVLDNRDGASATIFGGLLYIVRDADPNIPAFLNTSSVLRASFVEESFRANSNYAIYVRGPGQEILARDFPNRNHGRVVPWLFTGATTQR